MTAFLFAAKLADGRPRPAQHSGRAAMWRLNFVAASALCVLPMAFGQTATGPTNSAIGRMTSAVGTVTLESQGSGPRLVSVDTDLRVGDVVQTQTGSSAGLRYTDGTHIQLGQRSRMTINEFLVNAEQPAEERFIARLFTGAMRVVTGLVSKRRPANARFSTSTATIGVRGTDFVIRECAADCSLANTAAPLNREIARASEELAGRLAQAVSPASVATGAAAARPLPVSAAFRAGDTLSTSTSAALFVLRDGTRIALDPNSSLLVRAFEFDEAAPATGRIALVLLRGKVQLVAGQITRARAEQMALLIGQVAVRPGRDAALGVALQTGTGSELVQVSNVAGSIELQSTPRGAFTRLEAGTVVTVQAGGATVAGGEVVFEAAAPGAAAVDTAQLFGSSIAQPDGQVRPGTYVFVNGGAVMLGQGAQDLLVEPGETSFAPTAGGLLEQISGGPRVAGITALGLQILGNGSSCRADGLP